jgi:hypothetical protein
MKVKMRVEMNSILLVKEATERFTKKAVCLTAMFRASRLPLLFLCY